MKTIIVCTFLLFPHNGEGLGTTTHRFNLRDADTCQKEAGRTNARNGKNICRCEAPRPRPNRVAPPQKKAIK